MREKYARSGLSPDGTWYEISGSESAEVPVVMIHGVGPVSYTHLTLPTIYSV